MDFKSSSKQEIESLPDFNMLQAVFDLAQHTPESCKQDLFIKKNIFIQHYQIWEHAFTE